MGLLAEVFLKKDDGAAIVMIPDSFGMREVIDKNGGQAVVSRTGHAYVKLQ